MISIHVHFKFRIAANYNVTTTMALSSLQAQLASLEATNPQPGVVYSKNKRPEDAVGQGIQSRHPKQRRRLDSIPLGVLKERAVEAMSALVSSLSLPWLTIGRLENPDALIFRVLAVLSRENLGSVETMLEYLLRKANHPPSDRISPLLMPDLVFMMLYNPKLGRFLDFVDLNSDPTFIWLRPYVVLTQQSNPSELMNPPLEVLARHVWQHASWFHRLLQTCASLVDLTENVRGKHSKFSQYVSGYLSWSASVVVRAMVGQSRAIVSETVEDRIRRLLPTVLASCGNTVCSEWRHWGYLVASTVAEQFPSIRMQVLDPVVERIWMAATTISVANNGPSDHDSEVATTALATIVSILQATDGLDAGLLNDSCGDGYLELLDGSWLGCRLSDKSFTVLTSSPGKVKQDGGSLLRRTLVQLSDRHPASTTRLLVSLFAVGWRHNPSFALQLLDESQLWSNEKTCRFDLVASLTAHVMMKSPNAASGIATWSVPAMERLHEIDATSCERGASRSLAKLPESVKQTWSNLIPWLLEVNNERQLPGENGSGGTVLPLSVAMDHANVEIRLRAIRELSASVLADDCRSKDSELLLQRLLRRWSREDDEKVALAICELVEGLLSDPPVHASENLSHNAVAGLEYWKSKGAASVVERGISMSSALAAQYWRQSNDEPTDSTILEWLVGHLDLGGSSPWFTSSAATGILSVLADDSGQSVGGLTNEHTAVRQAKSCIVKNETFLKLVLVPSKVTDLRRQRCQVVVLDALVDAFEGDGASLQLVVPDQDLVGLLLTFIASGSPESISRDYRLNVVRKSLHFLVARIKEPELVIQMVILLSGVPSKDAYVNVSRSAMLSLISGISSSNGASVSPYAVLMEASCRDDTPQLACERLLALANDFLDSADVDTQLSCALAMGLCTLSHGSSRVQKLSLKLVKKLKAFTIEPSMVSLSLIPSALSEIKGAAHSKTNTSLASLLADCARSDPSFAKELLHLVLCIAAPDRLAASSCSGGFVVIASLLDAMEKAGEKAFPLSLRWSTVGKPVLSGVLSSPTSERCPRYLLEVIVRMMRGVVATDPHIVISTGPQTGGVRSRSYSLENGDVSKVLTPYPDDMSSIIVDSFVSSGKSDSYACLAQLISDVVFGSKVWREAIFPSIPLSRRMQVMSAYLTSESAAANRQEGTFVLFPLHSADINHLLDKQNGNEAVISQICDFIRANSSVLSTQSESSSTAILLLENIKSLFDEARDKDRSEDPVFMQQTLLIALSELLGNSSSSLVTFPSTSVQEISSHLAKLLAASSKSSGYPSMTRRGISAALSSLSSLFPQSPAVVGQCLLSLIESVVSDVPRAPAATQLLQEVLSTVVPLVEAHNTATSLSWFKIFTATIQATKSAPLQTRGSVYRILALALVSKPPKLSPDLRSGYRVASFVAMVLTEETTCCMGRVEEFNISVQTILESLKRLTPLELLSCAHLLLRYGQALMIHDPNTCALPSGCDEFDGLVSPSELIPVGIGQKSSPDATWIESLVGSLFDVCGGIIALDTVQKFVERFHKDSSLPSLHFWQDLLIVESSIKGIQRTSHRANRSLPTSVATLRKVEYARHVYQGYLPLHAFTACVSSLLSEESTLEVLCTSLELLAERIQDIDPMAVEAQLFSDLFPQVVRFATSAFSKQTVCLHHAALLCLERLSRLLGHGAGGEEGLGQFADALTRCSNLLHRYEATTDLSTLDRSEMQFVCSVSAACTALVTVLGARILPCLSRLFKPLVSLLKAANALANAPEFDLTENSASVRILQLSLLQCIAAAMEVIPQFLSSYLPLILSENAALSSSVRSVSGNHSESFVQIVDKIDRTMASIPCRIFVSAAAKSVVDCRSSVGLLALARVTKQSLEKATFAEVAAQRHTVIQIVTHSALVTSEAGDDAPSVLAAVAELLIALVMKLSEVQLRQVITSLQEWWRNDSDRESCMASKLTVSDFEAQKRLAFWTLMAALSKELYGIFLPCLGLLVQDMVDEVKAFCALLREREDSDSRSRKRRRLGQSSHDSKSTCLEWLCPLLQCLEHALRADARDGGNWVRSENNSRFQLLLEPVASLLLHTPRAKWNSDASDSTSHELGVSLLEQTAQCLTALAAAAGSEPLWKALNHWLLKAASDTDSVVCRQWGLQCLLSVFESIGEEYMVLLPECLPVLSERLEDDEHVAALARQCISVAEDLIGESLEDNL